MKSNDHITVATSATGARLGKVIQLVDGKIIKSTQRPPRYITTRRLPININAPGQIAATLKQLTGDPNSFLIYGTQKPSKQFADKTIQFEKYVDGNATGEMEEHPAVKGKAIARRAEFFEAKPQRLHWYDGDGMPGFNVAKLDFGNPEKVLREAGEILLGSDMKDSTVIWHLSSSFGMDPGVLRAHPFVITKDKMDCYEFKTAIEPHAREVNEFFQAKSDVLDMGTYQTIRPLFISDPITKGLVLPVDKRIYVVNRKLSYARLQRPNPEDVIRDAPVSVNKEVSLVDKYQELQGKHVQVFNNIMEKMAGEGFCVYDRLYEHFGLVRKTVGKKGYGREGSMHAHASIKEFKNQDGVVVINIHDDRGSRSKNPHGFFMMNEIASLNEKLGDTRAKSKEKYGLNKLLNDLMAENKEVVAALKANGMIQQADDSLPKRIEAVKTKIRKLDTPSTDIAMQAELNADLFAYGMAIDYMMTNYEVIGDDKYCISPVDYVQERIQVTKDDVNSRLLAYAPFNSYIGDVKSERKIIRKDRQCPLGTLFMETTKNRREYKGFGMYCGDKQAAERDQCSDTFKGFIYNKHQRAEMMKSPKMKKAKQLVEEQILKKLFHDTWCGGDTKVCDRLLDTFGYKYYKPSEMLGVAFGIAGEDEGTGKNQGVSLIASPFHRAQFLNTSGDSIFATDFNGPLAYPIFACASEFELSKGFTYKKALANVKSYITEKYQLLNSKGVKQVPSLISPLWFFLCNDSANFSPLRTKDARRLQELTPDPRYKNDGQMWRDVAYAIKDPYCIAYLIEYFLKRGKSLTDERLTSLRKPIASGINSTRTLLRTSTMNPVDRWMLGCALNMEVHRESDAMQDMPRLIQDEIGIPNNEDFFGAFVNTQRLLKGLTASIGAKAIKHADIKSGNFYKSYLKHCGFPKPGKLDTFRGKGKRTTGFIVPTREEVIEAIAERYPSISEQDCLQHITNV